MSLNMKLGQSMMTQACQPSSPEKQEERAEVQNPLEVFRETLRRQGKRERKGGKK